MRICDNLPARYPIMVRLISRRRAAGSRGHSILEVAGGDVVRPAPRRFENGVDLAADWLGLGAAGMEGAASGPRQRARRVAREQPPAPQPAAADARDRLEQRLGIGMA